MNGDHEMEVRIEAMHGQPALRLTPSTDADHAALRAMLEAEHAGVGRIRLITSSHAAGQLLSIVMGVKQEAAR